MPLNFKRPTYSPNPITNASINMALAVPPFNINSFIAGAKVVIPKR
jgi:hypothetical protein